jgi:hypothetical protein
MAELGETALKQKPPTLRRTLQGIDTPFRHQAPMAQVLAAAYLSGAHRTPMVGLEGRQQPRNFKRLCLGSHIWFHYLFLRFAANRRPHVAPPFAHRCPSPD